MKNLVSAEELLRILGQPDLVVCDCRSSLSDTDYGRRAYDAGHVPGAVFFPLDLLCAPVAPHGGRHPLPDPDRLAAVFERGGLTSGRSSVIVYDDRGGGFASRMWWSLRWLGHNDVRLLDGGIQEYIRSGGKLSTENLHPSRGRFQPAVRPHMLAELRDVRDRDASIALVDCRAHDRYRGEREPIDQVAGHIPGARNHPWQDTLDADGKFLSASRLRDRFADADGGAILYCGSGVTACVNVLAMEEAGLGLPRLYAGSWSDWISYPENPVAVGG